MGEGSGSGSNESHFRLSKKVAQLTKVIVQLNTVNENYQADKRQLIESHNTHVKNIHDKHAEEIQRIEEDVGGKLALLQGEVKSKESALQEHIADSVAREKKARDQLASVQREARERVVELQSNHEKERISHAHTVREISQSLEDQSRQHQENLTAERNEMVEDYNMRMRALREEIDSSHAKEIELLNDRHQQEQSCIQTEASEQEKLAVENAVACIRLEYEAKLSQQNSSHNDTCEAIKAEMADKLSREVERMKVEVEEVNSLRAELAIHVGNEKKMQADVKRLQTSLDSMTSSNQEVITGLQEQNAELLNDARVVNGKLATQMERINGLEVENDSLKSLLDRIDMQKSALQNELREVSEARDKEHELSVTQLKEKLGIIGHLEREVGALKVSKANAVKQLSTARDDIVALSKYKDCVKRALPTLQCLKDDADQCRAESVELAQLFASAVAGFVDWRSKMIRTHGNETSTLENESRLLKQRVKELSQEVNELQSKVKDHKISIAQAQTEAKTTKISLEKKIKYLEQTAENVAIARTGERLSWEKAIEDMKAQHKKEQARVCCMAMDEADILGNQIAELKNDIKKQREANERKCQLMEADWRHKMEDQEAKTSRIKYESALEIQGLSLRLADNEKVLASKTMECIFLLQNIDSMKEQQVHKEKEHQNELDALSCGHKHELAETIRLHEEQIQKKDNEIARIERENTLAQVEWNGLIAKERSERICELIELRGQLNEFKVVANKQIESIKHEWQSGCSSTISSKLKALQQKCVTMAERHDKEMAQLRSSHSKAEESLNRQIADTMKKEQEAKSMLFSTIRENKTKMEMALRRQKEDHDAELKDLERDSKIQHRMIAEKLNDLTKEYESLAFVNAKKVDIIVKKDMEINELKEKISNHMKRSEEDICSMKLQHEAERVRVTREFQQREATLEEKLRKERSDLQSKLQTEIDAITLKLKDANERWDEHESSEEKNSERIQSLQHEIDEVRISEKQSREKMLYFKRELENREQNFNKRFIPTEGKGSDDVITNPLRVIQNDNAKKSTAAVETKQSRTTTRRKVRGKTGSDTRKKKATSSKLPRIAK